MSPAAALLDELQAAGIEVRSAEGRLVVNSASALPDETRERIRAHKPGLLRHLDRERRRRSALRMLTGPATRYAFISDTGPEYVTLTVAIRDVGTFELTIDRNKWDGIRALELIEQGNAVS